MRKYVFFFVFSFLRNLLYLIPTIAHSHFLHWLAKAPGSAGGKKAYGEGKSRQEKSPS